MSSVSHAKVHVPSRSLLRFLRSQSETCFLGSRAPSGTCDRPANSKHLRQYPDIRTKQRSVRCFSTSAIRTATPETSFLDTLWPKSKVSNPSKSSANSPRSGQPPVYQPPYPTRHVSTNPQSLFRKLFAFRARHEPSMTQEALPLPALLDDGLQSSLMGRRPGGKASSELKLRCTELDENGNVTLVSGEFKKSELIAKVRHPRLNFEILYVLIALSSTAYFLVIFGRSILRIYHTYLCALLRSSSICSISES